MASQAIASRRGARTVRRQMWWKILILSVLVALLFLYIVVVQFCGAGLQCRATHSLEHVNGRDCLFTCTT
ncbi:hypothetical protein BDR07DRAFT_1402245 [Suillus spraguei]|nr:hypothetical protein BDR07DRAFT_1402245 [Suillus spraguei]